MDYLKPPTNVSKQTQKYYTELISEMDRLGMIKSVDITLLHNFAVMYDVYYKAAKDVLKEGAYYKAKNVKGDEIIRQHPALLTFKDAQIQLLKMQDALGITPKSRKQQLELENKLNKLDSPLQNIIDKMNMEN